MFRYRYVYNILSIYGIVSCTVVNHLVPGVTIYNEIFQSFPAAIPV